MEEESAVGKEGPACMRLFPSMLGLLLLAGWTGRDRRLTIAELHLQAAFLTSALVFLFAVLAGAAVAAYAVLAVAVAVAAVADGRCWTIESMLPNTCLGNQIKSIEIPVQGR
jgi:hypothetical protein